MSDGGVIADLVRRGWSPRQHHDADHAIEDRLVTFSVRAQRSPKTDTFYPADLEAGTAGDDQCWLHWPADGRRRTIGAWSVAFPVMVTGARMASRSGPCVPAPPPGQTVARKASAGADELHPLRKAREEDERFAGVSHSSALPSWAGPLPIGWTGIRIGCTEERSQETAFSPAFLGLAAPTRAGDPAMGTRVFDLTKAGEPDPKRYRELQSVLSVVDLGPGTPCVPAGKVLALNLGPAPLDRTAGWLVMADWDACSIGLPHWKQGNLLSVQAGGCIHQLGADADGHPIRPVHLTTRALFHMPGSANDAPLDFSGEPFDNCKDKGQHYSLVHLRHDTEVSHAVCDRNYPGRWRWQVRVPYTTIIIPDPPRLPPPPEPLRDPPVPLPPPGGGEPPPGGGDPGGTVARRVGGVDLGPGVSIPRGPTDSVRDGSVEDDLILQPGTAGLAPRVCQAREIQREYPASANEWVLGGLRIGTGATAPGQEDYTGWMGPLTKEQHDRWKREPHGPVIWGVSAGDGTWGGATTTRVAGEDLANSRAVVTPPGVKRSDVTGGLYEPSGLGGTRTPTVSTGFMFPGGLAVVDFAHPERTTTMVGTGGRIKQDATDGHMTLVFLDGGVEQTDSAVYVKDQVLQVTGTLQLSERAAPGTPSTATVYLYAKSDGKLYFKDDAGTEYTVATGSAAGLTAPADLMGGSGVDGDVTHSADTQLGANPQYADWTVDATFEVYPVVGTNPQIGVAGNSTLNGGLQLAGKGGAGGAGGTGGNGLYPGSGSAGASGSAATAGTYATTTGGGGGEIGRASCRERV